MGYALARSAVELGAQVTLVSGPTELRPPDGAVLVAVETTDQMYRAVEREFDRCDCLVMAAAPADFTPTKPVSSKIKKSAQGLSLNLRPTVDILASLAPRKRNRLVVGFALETDDALANARRKLRDKNLDLIVLNSPRDEGSAFGHDTNKVTLIRPGRKPETWPLLPKSEIAVKLLEKIASLL